MKEKAPRRPLHQNKLMYLILGIVFMSALIPFAVQQHGLNTPTPVGVFLNNALPTTTPSGVTQWKAVNAFPNLDFDDPTVFTAEPNSNRLYVASIDGLIHFFENDVNINSKTVFLDLRSQAAVVPDGGFLGLSFHPEFGDSNYVYVYYPFREPGTGSKVNVSATGYPGVFLNVWGRLSRFTVDPTTHIADPSSELVMIQKRMYNESHRGGAITFDNDGYLFLSLGEEFRTETAQIIDTLLEGGILRIDVDKDPTRSHAPVRTLPIGISDEISGEGYWIPNDNPFLDPTGNQFEEYYSIGHRNPHRLTYDSVEDRLWSGEIGELAREEINVIQKGGNYGWPFREGKIAGFYSQPTSMLGTLMDPTADFDRTEIGCVIGGYVYRGSDNPALVGKYLCADFNSSGVWALDYNAATGESTKELLFYYTPGAITTFGQDQDGELYICGLGNNSGIYKVTAETVSPEPPTLLSQTGVFTDMATLEPADWMIPYDLNEPFWSDGAVKSRWMVIPNDGTHNTSAEKISYSLNDDWGIPVGGVLVKHFELPIDETNPSLTKRLETRLMVHGTDGEYYGVTYRWRADNSDADLLVTGLEDTLSVATASSPREVVWQYPSRNACLVCHNDGAGPVLGPSTLQLNGDLYYPETGKTANQLTTLAHLEIFDTAIDTSVAGLADLPAATNSKDVTASLEDRARSYLHSNCSSCHQAGTSNRGAFTTKLSVPLQYQSLLYGELHEGLGITGSRVIVPGDTNTSILYRRIRDVHTNIAMPPLAKNRVDEAGAKLIADWIMSLNPESDAPGTGLTATYYSDKTLSTLEETRVEPSIDFNWGGGSPHQYVPGDEFSARFEGEILPLYGETYTFSLFGDDGGIRMWVDNQLIINEWGSSNYQYYSGNIALTAGVKVPIKIEYYEEYDEAEIHLKWKSVSQQEQIVPTQFLFVPGSPSKHQTITFPEIDDREVDDADFAINPIASSGLAVQLSIVSGPATISGNTISLNVGASGQVTVRAEQSGNGTYIDAPPVDQTFTILPAGSGNGNGLLGTYYDNVDFTNPVLTRVDSEIDFYWGSGSPDPAIEFNTFSVVWEGEIEAPYSETFSFMTTTDDGVKLYVDNVLIIDQMNDQFNAEFSGSIALTAFQKVPIRLEYYENHAYATARLKWASASLAPQVIPTSAMYAATPTSFPIELLSFEAEPVDNQVVLKWETASEINSSHFLVQKSKDGLRFESIEQIAAAGESPTTLDYKTVDLEPLEGRSYYRLQAIDLDGTFSYSDIESVLFESKEVQVYPNPTSQDQGFYVELNLDRAQPVTLTMFDQRGKVVLNRREAIDQHGLVRLPTDNLTPGIYFLVVKSTAGRFMKKVMIQ